MREYQLADYENALSNFHIIKRDNDIARARALHFHDYYQVYYVLEGELTHRVGEAVGRLAAGDTALIPPLHAHCIERSTNAVFYSVSFQTTFLPREIADGMLGEFLLAMRASGCAQPRLLLPQPASEQAARILSAMLLEFQQHDIAYVNVLQGLLSALLALLRRTDDALPAGTADAKKLEEKRLRILACTERIKSDLTAHTSLEEEARLCLMSRAQFCKAFQEITGTSFVRYRTRLRIDLAARMLREDARPIEQIAAQCGFQEYSSFYRSFLENIGTSPAGYRKLGSSRKSPIQE